MAMSSYYSDSDTLQETMDDEDATQCEEADDMINANDTISDTSQREMRYDHHHRKQKIRAEAMKQAELDIKTIEERKASGQVPKLIKKRQKM